MFHLIWSMSVTDRSKQHTYDDVVERVAFQISLKDASKIRLTSHNCYSQQPKPQPIKYRGVERLSDMLVHYNQTSDILYFETLDLPLPELQGLKTLKVAFHNAKTEEVDLLSTQTELRILEVFYHKIYKTVVFRFLAMTQRRWCGCWQSPRKKLEGAAEKRECKAL